MPQGVQVLACDEIPNMIKDQFGYIRKMSIELHPRNKKKKDAADGGEEDAPAATADAVNGNQEGGNAAGGEGKASKKANKKKASAGQPAKQGWDSMLL